MLLDVSNFEKIIGFHFKNKDLLIEALTHRSYLNENRKIQGRHNERLEFLGDAVLELCVTDFLYHKFKDQQEGVLTAYRAALVNATTLSSVATKIGMNDFLLLSRGEAKDVGKARQVILANAFEALIGAIYLDGGYEKANMFLEKNLFPLTDEIVQKRKWLDAKSHFQEKAQEISGITPSYKTLREVGPDHDKKFTVGVFLGDEKVAEGEGKSKQEAEQNAAEAGLQVKGWN